MNQVKKFGILSSSIDSTKVSTTVTGLVITLSSAILVVAPLAGLSLTAEQVATAAGQLGMAAGAIWTLYGIILKAVAFFAKRA